MDDSIYQYNAKYLDALDMVIKALEPKVGHWIPYIPYDGVQPLHFDCSKCGEPTLYVSKYCPNCGAKMENKG